ncbi:unnamed protein product [Knipowitschia caucasica]|uniref:Uncharacterized protein n=1 Tax=Knipowitschia caucasica TaxID=637954 RepID=A0AAV2MNU0_KNICA
MTMLPSLTKEDLRDLFPGPENFLRRRHIWQLVHGDVESQKSDCPVLDTSGIDSPPTPLLSSSSDSNICSPTPFNSPKAKHKDCSGATKKVRLISPEYVIYTDTELELARSAYFEKQRAGQDNDYTMPKDLRCRLIRNTVTSMIAIKRASEDDFKYPGPRELTAMAKRLVEYYPMLRDKSTPSTPEWEMLKKQLLKRVQNVTTPKKKQGATPSRKGRRSLKFQSSQETCTEESDEPFSSPTSVSSPASSVASSSASTVILEKSTPSTSQEDLLSESPQSQARHYKTLQDMYKTKNKPNKEDVSQLLELEFQSRRAFIDSDVMKEQDRPTKILQAYPCFKELSHIIDELHRILARGNPFFTMELKKRWLRFFNQAQFYGVFKKFIGPPLQDQVKNALAVLKVLPQMFPSHVGLPKRLGHPSDALFHILTSAEDPNTYLQSRPLVSPVVIVCETNCILAIGTVPLLTFPKEDLSESVMYLLGCYYTFHLTYPKCIGTLLSVLQTDVLLDAIHEKDMTTSYKKAMAEWRKFHE